MLMVDAVWMCVQLSLSLSLSLFSLSLGAVGNYNAHVSAYPEVDWLKATKDFITVCCVSLSRMCVLVCVSLSLCPSLVCVSLSCLVWFAHLTELGVCVPLSLVCVCLVSGLVCSFD